MIVARWLRKLKPKVVVIENVPEFLTSDSWRRLSRRLRTQGYVLSTFVLDVLDYAWRSEAAPVLCDCDVKRQIDSGTSGHHRPDRNGSQCMGRSAAEARWLKITTSLRAPQPSPWHG